MVEWGVDSPALWAPDIGNSWRTTEDIRDTWQSMLNNIDIVRLFYIFRFFSSSFIFRTMNLPSKPHLVDGMIQIASENVMYSHLFRPFDVYLVLEVGNGGMTDAEYASHFALWSISKAPLLIGADVRNIGSTALKILSSTEVIAINQDPLGVQGRKVAFALSKLSNTSSNVVISNCSTTIDPRRHQWEYYDEDRSIRSVYNNQCLSIENCNTGQETNLVVSDCHINDGASPCAGKNQQWNLAQYYQDITSHLNGLW